MDRLSIYTRIERVVASWVAGNMLADEAMEKIAALIRDRATVAERQRRERDNVRPTPIHFPRPKPSTMSACGLNSWAMMSTDTDAVTCSQCRKTVRFRQALQDRLDKTEEQP